jgi:hypothetical protein
MNYTKNLVQQSLPSWIDFNGRSWDTNFLTSEQLESQGWLPLIYDTLDAPLGYADPVLETRDGKSVSVSYAIGTPEERRIVILDQAKDAAHVARTAERLKRQTSGFPYDGHMYASDREESIPLLTSAVILAQTVLAQGPEAIAAFEAALGAGWRDMNGDPVITTAIGILQLHGAFVAWGAFCDRASQLIKIDIDTSTTLEEVQAIDIINNIRWTTYG